ncbi:MAG: glycosyltransferase family 39 protein [Anaerolineae bacterium]|nr:glycosyltransferase family 39 protein [Anaerolineae bacterium]
MAEQKPDQTSPTILNTNQDSTRQVCVLDRPAFHFFPHLSLENVLVAVLLILALVSRFYQVGERVMAHDEVNHVVPAYDLYMGRGYAHDPVTHGPLQFHLLAASYFLFGDSDLSSRIPAALFSVAAIAFVLFAFPRYIGRTGALLAGLFFLISPFLLFYGRYTRNEAFIELFAVMMLYAVLRYLERKDNASLLLLTITTALHFTAKETAYIYTAELMIFLAIFLFVRLVRNPLWRNETLRQNFVVFSVLAILLFAIAFGFEVWHASQAQVNESGTAIEQAGGSDITMTLALIFGAAFLVAAVADVIYLIRNLGWESIRNEASFDLLMLLGTLVLPLLVAFPIRLMGSFFPAWDPLDYTNQGLVRTAIMLAVMLGISMALGYWWNFKKWSSHMIIFYAIFTVFYTTFFTNGRGFFTGLVGALGYWLVQQSVERGTQPLFYYALLQMPFYEYLSIAGLAVAAWFGLKTARRPNSLGVDEGTPAGELVQRHHPDRAAVPVPALLIFWSIMNLVVFSIAGERMPWLTVHIALPFCLAAAWGLGQLIERIDWKQILQPRHALTLLLLPLVLISFLGILGALFGDTPPFQGKELQQLQDTSTFLLALLAFGASLFFMLKTLRGLQRRHLVQLLVLTLFIGMTLLTARTAYMAAYVNDQYPTEYLVYAHASPAPKEILSQIESISYRITGGKDLDISYDNDSLYPYWWYFRDYTNVNYFGEEPTRDIADSAVILASTGKISKIDSIVKDNYVKLEYTRLWWPNQDYFNFSLKRAWEVLQDPPLRTAIFNIWLNRDYTRYGEVKNTTATNLETWSPADKFTFYIRKDVVAQMWEYGASPSFEFTVEEDPYIGNVVDLQSDFVFGSFGSEPGSFNTPRGIAAAPDGSLYVADSLNNRIQHFTFDGVFINEWGGFGDAVNTGAPGGTFNEPWDVAVGPDGSVYVADTWNHRIQKFTAEGDFITMWGYFGTAETPDAMWGPRSVVVDQKGLVYVTDTGNKRVVVFTEDGEFFAEFGGAGFDPGKFDEPVGLAIAPDGKLFVADTWNRRIQSFLVDVTFKYFGPEATWDIYGWFSESLDNKPYIDIDGMGYVYATDPEGYRILQFDSDGNFVQTWGDYSPGEDGFGLPSGITVDPLGGLWVSDAANNRLLHFTLP